jgi:hypothetical protein
MEIPRLRWSSREELLQELDARVRIKDIKAVYDLKDALQLRWWEPLLKMLVIVAGIGFAVTFIHLLDRGVDVLAALDERTQGPGLHPETAKLVFWFIAGCFSVMLIAGLVSLEILLARIAAMRRLHEIELKVIEHLQAEMEEMRAREGAARQAPPADSPR